MGIYDRQYYSDDERQPGIQLGGSRMMVTNLVIINIAIYVVDSFLKGQNGRPIINDTFSLHADVLTKPWLLWQLLSYGFLHSINNVSHVLFNMLGLWMLGRDVEQKYGPRRFLQFYLSTIILSGLGWVLCEAARYGTFAPTVLTPLGLEPPHLIGASGGVFGVIAVFVLSFPHRRLYIWGILPIPAWGLGLLLGITTAYSMNNPNDPVAHSAHAVGALAGVLFFKTGWQLGNLIPGSLSLSALKPRPKIRIHDPDAKQRKAEEKLSSDVDRILEKISREGEGSLTARERKTLQDASRKYQQRDS